MQPLAAAAAHTSADPLPMSSTAMIRRGAAVERLLRGQGGGRSDHPAAFRAGPPDHRDRAARHGDECRAPGRPVNGRTSTCQRDADLVIGALAQAAPERCIAAGNGSCTTASFAGIDPKDGRLWVISKRLAAAPAHARRPACSGNQRARSAIANTRAARPRTEGRPFQAWLHELNR